MKKNLSTRDALLELRTVVAADSAKADKIKELTEQTGAEWDYGRFFQ